MPTILVNNLFWPPNACFMPFSHAHDSDRISIKKFRLAMLGVNILEERESPFPGFTEYNRTRFLCCNRTLIPAIHATYWGHWEVSMGMPSVVLILILSSFGMAVASMYAPLSWGMRLWFIPLIIFAVLFVVSYLRVITDGPGFFPFYYPRQHPSRNGSLLSQGDDHSPSGIISTPEQKAWALARPRPNRCILSTLGRRIVIRPDHFCGWTESWIGKRNYKFFLLFNIWGSLYISVFLVLDIATLINALQDGVSGWNLVHFLYGILGIVFVIMTCMFVESHGKAMVEGQTQWEIWNQIDPERYNEGCERNMEDVCGTGNKCCWCCPVSPWTGMTNRDLVAEYTRDYGKEVQVPESN
jgi:hypothetical protein